jgi:hypothetical protein
MGDCLTCKAMKRSTPALSGTFFCAEHQPKSKALNPQQSAKLEADKLGMKKGQEEFKKREPSLVEKAAASQLAANQKAERIKRIAGEINTQALGIVNVVKSHRKSDPDTKGINAGTNPGFTTLGGEKNPLKITIPADDKGKVSIAEIMSSVPTKDISWATGMKLRFKDDLGYGQDILVHVEIIG